MTCFSMFVSAIMTAAEPPKQALQNDRMCTIKTQSSVLYITNIVHGFDSKQYYCILEGYQSMTLNIVIAAQNR